MKIYLDVCCLNRPFDDQGQVRVREESEAIVQIIQRVVAGEWTHVSSDVVTLELEAMPDAMRRAQVEVLLSSVQSIIRLTMPVFRRAAELQRFSLKIEDSLHVAAAEAGGADVMLSCDDSVCRKAIRYRRQVRVRVANPVKWLEENE